MWRIGSNQVQPTVTPTVTSTPQPAWVTDFADPVLAYIANRPPDILDEFNSVSSSWEYGSWCSKPVIINSEIFIDCGINNQQFSFNDFVAEIDVVKELWTMGWWIIF